MFTNLYRPKLGGVSISVDRFSECYRRRGHEVLIVAPDYPGQREQEEQVVRVPSLQQFAGSEFSLAYRPGHELEQRLDAFGPEIIHSHHPFLLGDSAVRASTHRNVPLVYTHHTMYEHYTHYFRLDFKVLRNFVAQLATRYSEFCNLVIAPSESVETILHRRGVACPVRVIPTGVVLEEYSAGDGGRARRRHGLPEEAFVIGHVGRLAREKNLGFLTRAAVRAMGDNESAWLLVVGSGEEQRGMEDAVDEAGLAGRTVFTGPLSGRDLADAYAAMDVFAFASRSETQGMVLVESLAAGTPVVALEAPGAREVVRDGRNGRLVQREDERAFADALLSLAAMDADEAEALRRRAREDARPFRLDRCADRALEAYGEVLQQSGPPRRPDRMEWNDVVQAIHREWEIWLSRAASLTEAIVEPGDAKEQP
jgi:glycosyltransferase involved in cell wall biosynthesis